MNRSADGRARMRAGAALVACLITPGVLTWAWSRPAPAAPLETPPLVLDPGAIAAVIAEDRRAAEGAPEDAERLRLYRESNVAEHEGAEPPGRARARQRALEAALAAVVAEHGEGAVDALRARDVARAEEALRGALPAGDRVAELGGFPRMMRRYGLARGDRQIAPRFVIRVTLRARWNAMHGRELTEGFSPIEARAYWGWLAIRGEGAGLARRMEAIERYAEAGGARADELRGVLAYHEGELEQARRAFEDAYAARPSFRLRNHVLACRIP